MKHPFLTIALSALGVLAAMWAALAWHMNPVHDELTFLHEQVVAIRGDLSTLQVDSAVIRRDVDSVVGFLRGQGGLPRLMMMDGGCER